MADLPAAGKTCKAVSKHTKGSKERYSLGPDKTKMNSVLFPLFQINSVLLFLINSVLLNLLCVWILFQNASSHSCFRFLQGCILIYLRLKRENLLLLCIQWMGDRNFCVRCIPVTVRSTTEGNINQSDHTCHHPHRFNELATKSEKWNGKPRLECVDGRHPPSKTPVGVLPWTCRSEGKRPSR